MVVIGKPASRNRVMSNLWKRAALVGLTMLFAGPALATSFYLALNTNTGDCHVMVTDPDGQTMKRLGVGAYQSYDEAADAMSRAPECD